MSLLLCIRSTHVGDQRHLLCVWLSSERQIVSYLLLMARASSLWGVVFLLLLAVAADHVAAIFQLSCRQGMDIPGAILLWIIFKLS